MKNTLYILIILFFNTLCFATPKSSGGSNGKEHAWIGLGLGNSKIASPEDTQVFPDGLASLLGGVEWNFSSHLCLDIMVAEHLTKGKLNYDYLNGTHYTYNKLEYQGGLTEIGLGLKWNLLGAFPIGPYLEAGMTIGTAKTNYINSSVLSAQGATFKSDEEVLCSGTYGDAGIEIRTGGYGARFGGRYMLHKFHKMVTLGGNTMKSTDYEGYAALTKSF